MKIVGFLEIRPKKVCETFVGASGPKKLDAENYVKWSFDWVQWQPDGKLTLFE